MMKPHQKEKRSRDEAQYLTDLVLEAIRQQPLYRHDLIDMFNLERGDLNNFLCRLKNNGLIEIYAPDKDKHQNKRRWYKTERTESYHEVVKASQVRSQTAFINSYKGDVTFSPHANPAMCRTSMSYHTKGNTSKINAWAGYSSMGAM